MMNKNILLDNESDAFSKPELDINNDEHIVQAVMAVAGTGKADGLNDSTKQAPNKLLLKMTRATASIRDKMQKEIDKGKTPEEAALEHDDNNKNHYNENTRYEYDEDSNAVTEEIFEIHHQTPIEPAQINLQISTINEQDSWWTYLTRKYRV